MRGISTPIEYDVESIAALNNRFAADGLTLTRSEQFVLNHLEDYLVARDNDGHVIGCVCIDEYSPSLTELVSLAVEPAQQGKGIGGALIRAAVALAKKRQYTEIFAVSFSDDLFEHCGFQRFDISRFPEKKRRYDPIAVEEWTIGLKHCFGITLLPC